MKNKVLLIACIAGASVWSCGSDSQDNPEENIVEAVSASSFSYVSDVATGVGLVFEGPTYRIKYNEDALTAEVKMENIRFADAMSPTSYLFSGVPYTVEPRSKTKIIDIDRITPDSDKATVFTDLEIVALPTENIDGVDMDGVTVSYRVNNSVSVTNVPYRAVFAGTTETVNTTDQSSFISTETTYTVDIDPRTMTGVLKVNKASFAAAMPQLGTMEFAGLAVTIVDGGYILTCDSLVPTIGSTPYPRYTVTNLRMEVDLHGDSELKFTCMGFFDVTAVYEAAYTPSK